MSGLNDLLNASKVREKARAALCSAIKNRQIIELYYHDNFRKAEPYCLGVIMPGEADNEFLWCYQVDGHSEYGESIGWKLYRVSEITDLSITDECFYGKRPGYETDKFKMDTIHARVSEEDNNEVKPEPMPEIKVEAPPSKPPGKQKTVFSIHDEKMRSFRLAHPALLTGLHTVVTA